MPDPEIDAMSSVFDALSGLGDDEDARSRVLRWAAEKFGVTLTRSNHSAMTGQQDSTSDTDTEPETEDHSVATEFSNSSSNGTAISAASFDHFAELFDAVQPKTDLERAMAAAYWEQVVRGRNEWQSQTINKELKDLGHYITRINEALSAGMRKRPALVLQLKKSGSTQQGRKTYKLSAEGLKFIRTRIEQSS